MPLLYLHVVPQQLGPTNELANQDFVNHFYWLLWETITHTELLGSPLGDSGAPQFLEVPSHWSQRWMLSQTVA